MERFTDRTEAGRRLGERLNRLGGQPLVVVGLPRGGIPVAREVARALSAPLDVIVVRKLGVPTQPELGMGAIGEDDVRVINREIVHMMGVTPEQLAAVEAAERIELDRRALRYRGCRPPTPLAGRTVVIVDDGIATGSTARAACQVARARGAARVILAVPVAPPEWVERLGDVADELVALLTPRDFAAVGQAYVDFRQVSDDEVRNALDRSPSPLVAGATRPAEPRDQDVSIEVDGVRLTGRLTVPERAMGIVVFAHGSGSGRHSPRNQYVAAVLHRGGFATLLLDLLTLGEQMERANVFDVELLADRLVGAIGWIRRQHDLRTMPLGLFGASTGAAAALTAAADPTCDVRAVVSRGGRPDLAASRLPLVTAPTLLIVGGADTAVLQLNEVAAARLGGEHRVSVVPDATHLFEEPGALAHAAALARSWFSSHLPA